MRRLYIALLFTIPFRINLIIYELRRRSDKRLSYLRNMRHPRQVKERVVIGLVVLAIAALVQGVRWLFGWL